MYKKTNIFYISLFVFLFCLNSFSQKYNLSVQTGHSLPINKLSFNKSGTLLASAGEDNIAIIWDVKSGKQMMILAGHTKSVNSVLFHPNKSLIATAGNDNCVILWDFPSGKIIKKISVFSKPVKSIDFNYNGSILACGSDKLYLIDMNTYEITNLNFIAKRSFTTVKFANNSNIIAFGGIHENKVRLFDIDKQTFLKRFSLNAFDLNFDNNDEFICGGGLNGNIKKVNLTKDFFKINFNITAERFWQSFTTVAVSQNYIIAGNKNSLITVRSANSGRLIKTLKAHSDNIKTVCLSSDESILASAGNDQIIILWNLKDGSIIKSIHGYSNPINTIAFADFGSSMIIGYNNGLIKKWDLLTNNIQSYTLKPNFFDKIFNRKYEITDVYQNNNYIIAKTNLIGRSKKNDSKIKYTKNGFLKWNIYTNSIETSSLKKTTYKQSIKLFDSTLYIYTYKNFTQLDVNSIYTKKTATTNKNTFVIFENKYIDDCIDKLGNFHCFIAKSAENYCYIFNKKNKYELFKKFKIDLNYQKIGISDSGKYIYFASKDSIELIELSTQKKVLKTSGIPIASFSTNEKLFVYVDSSNVLRVFNISQCKEMLAIQTNHFAPISCIQINSKLNLMATSSIDGLIKFWNTTTGDLIVSMAAIGNSEFVYMNKNNYYYISKGASKGIGFKVEDKLFPFEQFDIINNRPDLVLKDLKLFSNEKILAFNKAYQKRLSKTGFNEGNLSLEGNVPLIQILNSKNIPLQTNENTLNIEIKAIDKKYKINRLNIWVNDVPIWGIKGISLKNELTDSITKSIPIILSIGKNKIQVSCVNENGIESLKETIEILYTPKQKVKPNLYVITIAVSNYKDISMNLDYAAKDGRDFTKLIASQNKRYKNIFVDTLFDEQATKKNFLALKEKLLQSTVDDEVIIYTAGHGLLDKNLDFYFATHDVNFYRPHVRGLKYDEIEGLLDSIPARKKLLMMDACHTGEVDKDTISPNETDNILLADGSRGMVKTSKTKSILRSDTLGFQIGLQNSFELMQELFSNLSRGSGTVVISAAAGTGYALESAVWNNGIFTYSVLDGLKNKKADTNKDGVISISELKKYVTKNVEVVTKGKQKPTCRQENLEWDWRVW